MGLFSKDEIDDFGGDDSVGRAIEDEYARIDHINWSWGHRVEGAKGGGK